jgi:hypothetical protein
MLVSTSPVCSGDVVAEGDTVAIKEVDALPDVENHDVENHIKQIGGIITTALQS